ncbi:hypothetical protein Acr_05g0011320 [Actinidia rufa]|uniref:Uncharacterized protein n=1 Tax=Actinidia rufa TaxID=165716 RepID=A0A7J0ELZ2_9ERIC|nr:hypothetical protein Acr_05g0011320 [Actinidia rufa]
MLGQRLTSQQLKLIGQRLGSARIVDWLTDRRGFAAAQSGARVLGWACESAVGWAHGARAASCRHSLCAWWRVLVRGTRLRERAGPWVNSRAGGSAWRVEFNRLLPLACVGRMDLTLRSSGGTLTMDETSNVQHPIEDFNLVGGSGWVVAHQRGLLGSTLKKTSANTIFLLSYAASFKYEFEFTIHLGVMQPPIGAQKWERVLCLPLARSALPCRLTRHSALGMVQLCPVGLARHSTPGMVLVIKMQFGTAQCSTEATRCNSRIAHQNAVRNCPNAALNAARCNLRVARISFKHVYGLTVEAIKYGICMQFSECYDKRSSRHTARTYVVLEILRHTQLSAYCQTYVVLRILRHTQLSAYYQTYVVLRILRHTQLSAYYQTCSSRNTATHAALGILPESPPCAHHWRDHYY